MADAVTSQTINDGPRNAVMKFTNVSDGTGESAVTKVDVSALSGAPSQVRLQRIDFVTRGMGVNLLWDATADELIYSIPSDEVGTIDLSANGGFPNSEATGFTGDIKFTTVAHDSGDTYSITLHMVKKYT